MLCFFKLTNGFLPLKISSLTSIGNQHKIFEGKKALINKEKNMLINWRFYLLYSVLIKYSYKMICLSKWNTGICSYLSWIMGFKFTFQGNLMLSWQRPHFSLHSHDVTCFPHLFSISFMLQNIHVYLYSDIWV